MRGPGSNDTPVAMSTPRVQVLVSKYHFSVKGTKVLWRMTVSRAGAGKIHEPGASSSIRK